MTTQRKRHVLEQLGNASRGLAIVNEVIAAALLVFGYVGKPLGREELRPLGRSLVSLADVLTDLGVQLAADANDDETGNESSTTQPQK